MANIVTSPYAQLAASVGKVMESHDAIRTGIVRRAEEHKARMDAKREALARNQAINAGIERINRPV